MSSQIGSLSCSSLVGYVFSVHKAVSCGCMHFELSGFVLKHISGNQERINGKRNRNLLNVLRHYDFEFSNNAAAVLALKAI